MAEDGRKAGLTKLRARRLTGRRYAQGMRRKPPPSINPRMYRHFAALTVAITALLAFFANGENHEALAAAAGDTAAPAKPRAERPKPLVRQTAEPPGSWGSDENSGFGEPLIRPSGGFSAWMPTPPAPSAVQHTTRPGSLAGDDGREQPSEAASATAEPSAAQIAAIAAASRLRSGARGND